MTTGIESNKALDALGLSTLPSKHKTDLGAQDFMNLMMAQLKNQDPTKPMDSSAFLGQLAQFGSVSGINDLKTAFDDFSKSIYSNQALQASSLIGRTVLTPDGSGYLAQGGTLSGVFDLPASSPSVTLNVYGSNGQLVRQVPMGTQAAGEVKFQWDGLDADGNAAPPGTYTVAAEAQIDGTAQALGTMVAARVNSVNLGGGQSGLTLNLDGLGSMDFSSIKQIM